MWSPSAVSTNVFLSCPAEPLLTFLGFQDDIFEDPLLKAYQCNIISNSHFSLWLYANNISKSASWSLTHQPIFSSVFPDLRFYIMNFCIKHVCYLIDIFISIHPFYIHHLQPFLSNLTIQEVHGRLKFLMDRFHHNDDHRRQNWQGFGLFLRTLNQNRSRPKHELERGSSCSSSLGTFPPRIPVKHT